MPVERRQIEKALPRKGFVRHHSDHRYFHHVYKGKRTGLYTYTSHGSEYRTYDDSLLGLMKRQLRLDSLQQVRDLFKCPISGQDYVEILKEKGLIRD